MSTYYTIKLSGEFAYPIEPTAEHSEHDLLPRQLPPQCIWILPTSGVAVPRSVSISHFCRQIAVEFRHLSVNEYVVGVFLPTALSVLTHSQGRRHNTTVNKMTASLFTVQTLCTLSSETNPIIQKTREEILQVNRGHTSKMPNNTL